MKFKKTFLLFITGVILCGWSIPSTAQSQSIDLIEERTPDTSVLDDRFLIPKKAEKELSEPDVKETAAKINESLIQVGTEEFTEKILYTTYTQEDPPDNHLEPAIILHNDTYHLVQTGKMTLVKKETVQPDRLSFESELFTGEGEEHSPDDTVQRDGKSYKLLSKQLIETASEERTKYQETVVRYKEVEAGVEIPDEKEVEITDTATNQTVLALLQRKSQTITKEYWTDDFEFPITVTGYDATSFFLNGKEISRDADLKDYGKDFLEYLNLDDDYYIISDISWSGEPYQKDDNLVRNAVATGSKYVKDIDVTYGGTVTLPAIVGKVWSCKYEEILPPGEQILYTMAVEATYQLENVVHVEKSFYEKALGFITAVYEAVVRAIEDHPLATSIPVIIAAAFIVYFITQRRKGRCLFNQRKKCPFKNPCEETCRTCKHNRQKIKL